MAQSISDVNPHDVKNFDACHQCETASVAETARFLVRCDLFFRGRTRILFSVVFSCLLQTLRQEALEPLQT